MSEPWITVACSIKNHERCAGVVANHSAYSPPCECPCHQPKPDPDPDPELVKDLMAALEESLKASRDRRT